MGLSRGTDLGPHARRLPEAGISTHGRNSGHPKARMARDEPYGLRMTADNVCDVPRSRFFWLSCLCRRWRSPKPASRSSEPRWWRKASSKPRSARSTVATLPVSAGPAYVFVALRPRRGFLISASAIGSIAAHASTAVFFATRSCWRERAATWYCSVGGAVAVAGSCVGVPAPLGAMGIVRRRRRSTSRCSAICIALTSRYRHVQMPPIIRRWYDIPLRAILVSCLVATVVGLSGHVGPTVTGLLAVYPIVMTSLMLIFQPRVGGPATAALIANTMWGLGRASAPACSLAHSSLTVVPPSAPGRARAGALWSRWPGISCCTGWRRRALARRARPRSITAL